MWPCQSAGFRHVGRIRRDGGGDGFLKTAVPSLWQGKCINSTSNRGRFSVLAGPIPKELGALSELYELMLNDNALTGETERTQSYPLLSVVPCIVNSALCCGFRVYAAQEACHDEAARVSQKSSELAGLGVISTRLRVSPCARFFFLLRTCARQHSSGRLPRGLLRSKTRGRHTSERRWPRPKVR